MQGNVLGQSGGSLKINGIIEEYKVAAGENVNAGDFVKYVNEIETGVDTEVNAISSNSYEISAVKLRENKVFIVYSDSGKHVCGVILEIKGNEIEKGRDTLISSTTATSRALSITLVSENKVFAAYSGTNVNVNKQLFGMIITINENEITVGTETQLSSTDYLGNIITTNLIKENKVIIGHGNNNSLYGIIIMIEEDKIIKGTDTLLNSSSSSNKIKIIVLKEDKVFIEDTRYAMILTINERKITKGTNISIYSPTRARKETTLIKEDKILMIYVDSNNYLYGKIITINENKIIIEGNIETELNSTADKNNEITAILIDENKIYITYSNVNKYLSGMIVIVNENEIVKLTETQIGSTADISREITKVLINEKKIFIGHSGSDNKMYGIITMPKNGISQIKNAEEKILGLAKNKGTEGQTVKVYTPNIEEGGN